MRIPRLLIVFGALLVIVGAVFKLMHWGLGFLQANTLVGIGATLIVIALVIMLVSRMANK
ncbi:hypothetical protein SCB49_11844 [unidentified eubacterium SCB49]|nr:hypothetical protein SCB49_11844 [unidentified eubacterium SCB49]